MSVRRDRAPKLGKSDKRSAARGHLPPSMMAGYGAALFEQQALAALATDPGGIVLALNERAAQLFGLDPDSCLGRPLDTSCLDEREMRTRAALASAELGREISPGFDTLSARARAFSRDEQEWRVRKGAARLEVRAICEGEALTGFLILAMDLTPLLEAERAHASARRRLADQEKANKRLALVASNTVNAVVITDEEGLIEWVNEGFIRITGYTLDEVAGRKPGLVLQGPATDPRVVDDFRRAIAEVRPLSVEIVNYRKSGAPYWNAVELQPLFDEAGAHSGFMAIQADVTAEKRARNALKESESRFRLLFENAPIGMVLSDLDGGLVLANRAFLETTGLESSEVSSLSLADVLVDAGSEREEEELRELLTRGVVEAQERVVRQRGGRLVPVMVRRVLATDSAGRQRVATLMEDIGEKRAAERALRLSEQRLRDVIRAAGEYIWEIDGRGRYVFVSDQVEEILGYSVGEVIGRTPFDFMPPEEADRVRGFIESAQRSGEAFRNLEHACLTKSGCLAWQSISALPHRSERGELLGFRGAAQDISARKEAEKALIEARDAAEAATRAKANFLATMSHEIRTPLNGIIGMTALLSDDALPGGQREKVDTIRVCSESLLELLNDVLDFSRVESGRVDLEELPFSPHSLCEEVLAPFADEARLKDLALEMWLDQELPARLVGDPTRLRQVLTNLVSNAVKFTQSGRVGLSLTQRVSPGEAARFVFEVKDTGIGMSEEAQSRIFEAFTQADASTTRRFGGTGLGLSIARRLVELMDGELEVRSREGEGSVFRFSLPLGLLDESEPAAEELLAGLRLLSVDDASADRSALRKALVGRGVEIDEARDVASALRLVRESGRRYGLVLVDPRMPDVDGLTLVRLVRADKALRDLRIAFHTASEDAELLKQARALGVSTIIPKPARPSALRSALARCLGERAAEPAPAGEEVGSATLAGRSFLLVEDNPVNRRLAEMQLKRLGASVALANNGREGLQAFGNAVYSAVLMDVQMPLMDGYEATRAIRELERSERRSRTPIVAMTANALEGDRERCLDAGMDDYLAKPVRIEDLGRVLAAWTRPGRH